jgi:hypothetical protein
MKLKYGSLKISPYSSANGPLEFLFSDNDCGGPGYSVREDVLLTYQHTARPLWFNEFVVVAATGIGITLASTALVFGLMWTFGWMVTGFARD